MPVFDAKLGNKAAPCQMGKVKSCLNALVAPGNFRRSLCRTGGIGLAAALTSAVVLSEYVGRLQRAGDPARGQLMTLMQRRVDQAARRVGANEYVRLAQSVEELQQVLAAADKKDPEMRRLERDVAALRREIAAFADYGWRVDSVFIAAGAYRNIIERENLPIGKTTAPRTLQDRFYWLVGEASDYAVFIKAALAGRQNQAFMPANVPPPGQVVY